MFLNRDRNTFRSHICLAVTTLYATTVPNFDFDEKKIFYLYISQKCSTFANRLMHDA